MVELYWDAFSVTMGVISALGASLLVVGIIVAILDP